MNSKPHVLIIYGPTGVGKTDFALQIASQIPAEIINMDVGQLYTPLSIGTAKPDLSSVTVPHHCFDLLNTPEHFTVTAYRALCEKVLCDIWNRGKLPILVGGSGFYLKSLFFPPRQVESTEMTEVADTDTKVTNNNTDSDHLWRQLYVIDPARAEKINQQDIYRIKRALTIWQQTGKKPSECKPLFEPIADAHIIFLSRDRTELYDRINQRVDQMIEQGWLEETRSLLNTPWEQFIQHKKLIGYNELIDFLHIGEPLYKSLVDRQSIRDSQTMQSVLASIKQRTRHYAKRQFTFWRMFFGLCAQHKLSMPGSETLCLEEVNLTLQSNQLYSNQLYIKQLVQVLMTYIKK